MAVGISIVLMVIIIGCACIAICCAGEEQDNERH